MAARLPVSEVKALLQQRAAELVATLLPTAVVKGGIATVSSSRPGRDGGSFVVWIRGTSPGAWKDYATGDRGDIIDLIAFAQFSACHPFSKDDRKAALEWAGAFLGLSSMTEFDRTRARNFAAARLRERDKREAEQKERNAQRAFQMFMKARPLAEGAPAIAYLASRGVVFSQLEHLEGDVRYSPSLEWWMGARRDGAGRKVEPGPSFPALVSGMRDSSGAVRAVHCTFLAHDGTGKAPVDKPKLMWPATRGTVIRVAKGESGLTCEAAAEAGRRDLVVLTEGVEDALSIALARPDLRVWACGSLAGMAWAPVLPCVRAFIVGADNDWTSPAAMAGLERAVQQLRLQGIAVSVARSPSGKDFNDALRGDQP